MLDKLLSFALQQRVFVLAAALVLAIVGWRAVQDMPIEAFPDVQDVQVQIVTQSLGQAPEEVERSITLPIEREMSGVPRMTQLRSVSITGLSVVTLTFADHTDDYFARQQVMEKLQNVTLPPGAAAQPGSVDQRGRRSVSLCAGSAIRHVSQRGARISGLGHCAPPCARCPAWRMWSVSAAR